ncbi:glycerophosphodiester phosphodiesterase family protein [Mucilaginibacter gynuensis]
MKRLNKLIILLMLISLHVFGQSVKMPFHYHLIAHRGGVVDSTAGENSVEALQAAIKHGYWMIETDLRITKDGVFITHHDNTFKRSFGIDSAVSSMTWKQISQLNNKQGYKVQKFEAILKLSRGKLSIMIDNKISSNDTVMFARLITLLKKYNACKSAMMIGTDESTDFFTGKIKLSCTRKQLEDNMLKPGYQSSNYYLFSDTISKDDVDWARKNNIMVIGVINAWAYKSAAILQEAQQQAVKLKNAGVNYFQIDSVFEPLFK